MPMLLSVFLSSLQCALKMYQKWCGWLMVVFPMVKLHLYPDQNRCPLLSKIWSIPLQKSGASPFQKSHASPFQKSHHTPFQNLVIFPFKNLVHHSSKIWCIPLSKIPSYPLPKSGHLSPQKSGVSFSKSGHLSLPKKSSTIRTPPQFLQNLLKNPSFYTCSPLVTVGILQ